VDYGSALTAITNVLQGIQGLVEAIGGSVELDIGFSDNKLTVRDGFALPTLPLGLGELEHIAVDLGLSIELPGNAEFSVGLASQDDPFTWIVDPLAGNGAIVLGTSGGEMGVFIEAGIGLALAIDRRFRSACRAAFRPPKRTSPQRSLSASTSAWPGSSTWTLTAPGASAKAFHCTFPERKRARA
jgi:hypothetical protein